MNSNVEYHMLSETSIVLAVTRDAPAIAAMSRDYIEQGLGWRWTAERVLDSIRNPERNVVVIRDGNAVIAFGIMKYAEDYAHLELLAVLPKNRRQGFASAITLWLERAAQVAGVKRIFVECRRHNDAARNFYNEHCYHEQRIDKRMYRGLEDGIRLQKWLQAPESD